MYKIFPIENVPCGHFKFTLTSSRRRMFYEYSNVRTRLNKRRERPRVTYSSCRRKPVIAVVVMAVCRTTFIRSLTYSTFYGAWRFKGISFPLPCLSLNLVSDGCASLQGNLSMHFFFSICLLGSGNKGVACPDQDIIADETCPSTLKRISLVTSERNIRWNNSMVQTFLSH